MIYIHAIRLNTGIKHHRHIDRYWWRNPDTGDEGDSPRQEMIRWIKNGDKAYVCGHRHLARVGVVNADPPYLRTYADGEWNDNLLSLPHR